MRTTKAKSWNDSVAETLKFDFSDESLACLVYELAALIDSKVSSLILLSQDAKPHWPFKSRMSEREWKSLSLSYQDGAYLLDPFYHLSKRKSEGVFGLHDIVPDSFDTTEFYHIFYEKVAVVDEICAIIPLSDDITALLSVCRMDTQSKFESWAFESMYACYAILEIVIKKWWRAKQQDGLSAATALGPRLDSAMDNFGVSILTQREMQVARLCLEGYSVKAQAIKLELSIETVKSYKKHIYHKLDITSQAELFNLFIASLKVYNPDNGLDPLAGYL